MCEVCESSGSRSASAARVEPECFYFLRRAAGERHCEAAEFPRQSETRRTRWIVSAQIRVETRGARSLRPPLPGPLTQHACQSGAVEWSRNNGACFNTSAQPLHMDSRQLGRWFAGLQLLRRHSQTPRPGRTLAQQGNASELVCTALTGVRRSAFKSCAAGNAPP